MKSFIRRMIGTLMAFAMLFSSVVMPNPFKEANLALAENENTPVEELGEVNLDPPAINYVYLKTLYDLCFERAGGEVTTEPFALLEDVWENLLPQEQTLLRELVRGEKVFTVSEETGEVIGVQDRVYTDLLGTEQPVNGNLNNTDDDPENQTPAVAQNIQDPEPQLPGGDDEEDDDDEGSTGSGSAGSTTPQVNIVNDPLNGTLEGGGDKPVVNNDDVQNLTGKLGVDDVITNLDDLDDLDNLDNLDNQEDQDDQDDPDNLDDLDDLDDLDNLDNLDDLDNLDNLDNADNLNNLNKLNGKDNPNDTGNLNNENDLNNQNNQTLEENNIIPGTDRDGKENLVITPVKDKTIEEVQNNLNTNPLSENNTVEKSALDTDDEVVDDEDEDNEKDDDIDDDDEDSDNDDDEITDLDDDEDQENSSLKKKSVVIVEEIDLDTVVDDLDQTTNNIIQEEKNVLGKTLNKKGISELQTMSIPVTKGLLGDGLKGSGEPQPTTLTVKLSAQSGVYNGQKHNVTVIEVEGEPFDNTKYAVDPIDGDIIDVGSYTFTVRTTGDIIVTGSAVYKVTHANIDANISQVEYTYTGSDQKTAVKDNLAVTGVSGETPTEGKDYSIAFNSESVTNVGDYTVTVNGQGNYNESATALNFKVTQVDISSAELSQQTFIYTGSNLAEAVKEKLSISSSVPGATYDVSFQYKDEGNYIPTNNVTNTGEYKIVVEGNGNYKGTKEVEFTVENATLTVNSINKVTCPYDGVGHGTTAMLESTVTFTEGSDYELQYKQHNGAEDTWSTNLPVAVGNYDAKVVLTQEGEKKFTLAGTAVTVESAVEITLTEITSISVSGNTTTYNRQDASAPTLTFNTEDGTLSLSNDDYIIKYRVHDDTKPEAEYTLTSITDAGKYDIQVTLTEEKGKTKAKFAAEKDFVLNGYTINKANVTEASFAPSSKVSDGLTDWGESLTVDSEQTGKIVLTVKAGEITLNKTEIELGAIPEMKAVDFYSVPWALTAEGQKNFIQGDITNASFSVTSREFKLETINKTYNRENWAGSINSFLIVKDKENDSPLSSDQYTVTFKRDGAVVTDVTDAADYTIEVVGTQAVGAEINPYVGYSTSTVFKVEKAKTENATLTYQAADYNRMDWYDQIGIASAKTGTTYPNVLTVAAKVTKIDGSEDTITLSSDEFELGDAVEMKDAGSYTFKWKLTEKGSKNFEIPEGKDTVSFTVNKTKIDKAELTYDNADYNRKDWYDQIGVISAKSGADYPNVLTITAAAVKPIGEGSETITLIDTEGAEAELGEAAEMKDAGSHTFKWKLTEKGAKNFEIPEGKDTVIFTVNKTKIDKAELTYDNADYNRKDWYDQIGAISAKSGVDYPNVLTITAAAVKPIGEGSETITLIDTEGAEAELGEAVEMKDAGSHTFKWKLTEKGAKNFEILEGKDIVNFTVNKTKIDKAELTYDNADYNRKDWYDQIGAIAAKSGVDYPNVLTITAAAVKPIGEGSETITLIDNDGAEAELGQPVPMIDAGSYTFKWKLTEEGAKNFEIPTEKDVVSFTVNKTKIDKAELTYDNADYNRKDWYDQIGAISAKSGVDYPNVLTITATAVKPIGEGSETITLIDTDGAEAELGQPVPMIDAGFYTFKWKLTEEGAKNFEIPTEKDVVSFTVNKATIISDSDVQFGGPEGKNPVGYNSAPYTRLDWSDKMTVGSEPAENKDNHLMIKATASVTIGGETKTEDIYLLKGEAKITNNGFKQVASVPYKVKWELEDDAGTKNFEVAEGLTQQVDFTVTKATVISSELTYNKTYYNRSNWADQIKTYDEPTSNLINILTVKTSDPNPADPNNKDANLELTLHDTTTGWKSDDKEYEINYPKEEKKFINAGEYTLTWGLSADGAKNFTIGSEEPDKLINLSFTVQKAIIEKVTIRRDDEETATTAGEATYDHEDWRPRIGINSAKGNHHSFIITASSKEVQPAKDGTAVDEYTIAAFTLNTDGTNVLDEINLTYPTLDSDGIIGRVGTYPIQVNISGVKGTKGDAVENFMYDPAIALEPHDFDADNPWVQLQFAVKLNRYPVIPLRNETTSVTVLSADSVVSYADVYRFGPNQNQTARMMVVSGEPGEVVNVTVGNQTITGTISGTRFSNYDLNPAQYTGTMNLYVSSSGVLTAENGEGSIALTHNTDLTITLA